MNLRRLKHFTSKSLTPPLRNFQTYEYHPSCCAFFFLKLTIGEREFPPFCNSLDCWECRCHREYNTLEWFENTLPSHHSHEIGGFFRQFHLHAGHILVRKLCGASVDDLWDQSGIRWCCWWGEWGPKRNCSALKGKFDLTGTLCIPQPVPWQQRM